MMTPRSTIACMLTVLCLFAQPLAAQFGEQSIKLRDFSVSGQDEQGQQWRLSGKNTATRGPTVEIDTFLLAFRLKQKNKDNEHSLVKLAENGEILVTLESPSCTLNSITKEIKSAAPVTVNVGRNIRITGIGYDVDLNHKVILLRSTVAVSMKLQTKSLNVRNLVK